MAEIQPTEVTSQGMVMSIGETKQLEFEGKKQLYQKLEVKLSDGKKVEIVNGDVPVTNPIQYKVNDKLILRQENDQRWVIVDSVRTDGLMLLTILFVLAVGFISGKRGLGALLSVAISFGIIFGWLLPGLLKGYDPILMTMTTSVLMIPVTFFLSHGFNKKTWVAIGSTLLALLVTSGLAAVFIEITKLTGYSSEESGILNTMLSINIDMKGLLLSAVIIGMLGVLDDITVAQAGIVEQLKTANPRMKLKDLYGRAMKVGQDHIASMVNTLFLVYAGAALPLLMIFMNNPHPVSEILNYEFMAEEIVRTVVGSIGLILAVPITTFIASIVFENEKTI